MSKPFQYLYIGPPPKQPRKTSWQPQNSKRRKPCRIGRAEVVKVPLGLDPQQPLNEELLKEFDVKETFDLEGINAGQVIIAAKPFVTVQCTGVRGERCERCHAKKGRNGLRNCSNGCENVLYCSIECQESDYITHVASGECGLIQKRLPSNDNVRFILRFLLALRVIPGKDLPCIIDRVPGYSEPRSFRDLLDHYDDIVNSVARRSILEDCYAEIVELMGEDNAPPPDYFLEVYGRTVINSFNILDPIEQVGVAYALYIGPSIIDHSCQPTASVSFDLAKEGAIVVRSLVDMPPTSSPGNSITTQLFISYLDLMDATKRRKDHLLTHYYFTCQCPRCSTAEIVENEMFCIFCPHCKGGMHNMNSSTKNCSICDAKPPEDTEQRYQVLMELLEEQLFEKNASYITALFCKQLMERERFSPTHIYYIKIMDVIFDQLFCDITQGEYADDEDVLNEALIAGWVVVKGREKYQKNTFGHGLIMLKQSVIEEKLRRNTEYTQHRHEAFKILQNAVGHRILEEMLQELKIQKI